MNPELDLLVGLFIQTMMFLTLIVGSLIIIGHRILVWLGYWDEEEPYKPFFAADWDKEPDFLYKKKEGSE